MSYGSVPQENWDAIFEEPQNTALKQAERAQEAAKPVKRELTPEQKEKRREIMAKARAARTKKTAAPDVQGSEPKLAEQTSADPEVVSAE
jgi:hypothetical protein